MTWQPVCVDYGEEPGFTMEYNHIVLFLKINKLQKHEHNGVIVQSTQGLIIESLE